MTRSDLEQILALLKGSYPRQLITDATVRAYTLFLSDLDYTAAQAAVVEHVATSPYFPAIAELRDLVASRQVSAPDFGLAWSEVRSEIQRLGNYTRCGMPRGPRFTHSLIADVVKAIGWRQLCRSETPSVERATFRDMYALARGRALRDAAVLPMLRAAGVKALPERQTPEQSRRHSEGFYLITAEVDTDSDSEDRANRINWSGLDWSDTDDDCNHEVEEKS